MRTVCSVRRERERETGKVAKDGAVRKLARFAAFLGWHIRERHSLPSQKEVILGYVQSNIIYFCYQYFFKIFRLNT